MEADASAEMMGIEAKIILAEAANKDDRGGVNLLGAGLELPAGSGSFVVVLFLKILPHVESLKFRLELVDEHGQPLAHATAMHGDVEIEHREDGRPASAILPIKVTHRLSAGYLEWRLWLNDQTHSSWKAGFYA
jgi:hypothetical protein